MCKDCKKSVKYQVDNTCQCCYCKSRKYVNHRYRLTESYIPVQPRSVSTLSTTEKIAYLTIKKWNREIKPCFESAFKVEYKKYPVCYSFKTTTFK